MVRPEDAAGSAHRAFWSRPLGALLADLDSAPDGLSAAEAVARLTRFGPNEPAPPRRFEPVREIAAYLVNPLVLILLCASAVSAMFGQFVSSVIVAAMLLLSIALNFSQTYQSQRAARRLREWVGGSDQRREDGDDDPDCDDHDPDDRERLPQAGVDPFPDARDGAGAKHAGGHVTRIRGSMTP